MSVLAVLTVADILLLVCFVFVVTAITLTALVVIGTIIYAKKQKNKKR